MEKEEKINDSKNVITLKKANRALINNFIAYGLLFTIIFVFLSIIFVYFLNKIHDIKSNFILHITIPLILAILSAGLIRLTCRISTFDVFKKNKLDQVNIDKLNVKMGVFYLILILLSIVLISLNLNLRIKNERINVEEDIINYNQAYSDKTLANSFIQDSFNNFRINKLNLIASYGIIEFGIFAGLISLIPSQRKFILRYNKSN